MRETLPCVLFCWIFAKQLAKQECCELKAANSGIFGAKLIHLCGSWLDGSFFSHMRKHCLWFWLDLHYVYIVSFFMCDKCLSLLWLARTHLHMKINDIAFQWVYLSMYIIALKCISFWVLETTSVCLLELSAIEPVRFGFSSLESSKCHPHYLGGIFLCWNAKEAFSSIVFLKVTVSVPTPQMTRRLYASTSLFPHSLHSIKKI